MERKIPGTLNKKTDFGLPSYLKACPVCTKGGRANKLRLISQAENKIRFHLTCGNCKSSVLINAIFNELGAVYVGVLSDLSYQDSLKFKDKQEFCADDVLFFYNELKKRNHLEKKFIYNIQNNSSK